MDSYQERRFNVNDYCLAAKEWQPAGTSKIIALHGWLDNAASFDVLAPLLDDSHIVALDLPGHGHSDHKSAQASYQIWDDLLDILAVADALGWQHFHLLGHSRGAIIAMLLGASSPERIKSMLLLDGIWPLPIDIAHTARQLTLYLQQNRALVDKKLPEYSSLQDALLARCRSARMSETAAKPIVERALQQSGDKFYWRSDPRLTTASAVKLSAGHIDSLMEAITIPCLLLLAEQGMGSYSTGAGSYSTMLEQLKRYPSIRQQHLAGSHHFHLEQQAPEIAAIATGFFSGD